MFTYIQQINFSLFESLYQLGHSSSFVKGLVLVVGRDLDIYVLAFVMLFFLVHHDKKKIDADHDIGMSCVREMILISFSAIFAWMVTGFLKFFFAHPRPFEMYQFIEPLFLYGGGDSFPSGHATLFAALTVMVGIVHRGFGWVLVFVTLAISLSRIMAGIHFPVDVLAGWIIGVGVSYLVYKLFKPKICDIKNTS